MSSSLGNSTYVYIYKGGELLTSGSISTYGNGTVSLTIDDSYVGQNVVYMSSYGHQGTLKVVDGVTQDLNFNKLTVTTKDKAGNALTSQNVNIYDENNKSYSVYIGSNGEGNIYLPASSAYTYQWNYDNQEGNIDLTKDNVLNLVKGGSEPDPGEPVTNYNLKIVCRYGDYPVNFGSNYSTTYFYIYKYGETGNTVKSISMYSSSGTNSGSTQIPAGSYWIKDPYYGFSQKIEVNSDMTAYLDYKKVTFVSKAGNTPNVGQSIGYNYQSSYSQSTSYVTTNANGEATVYRLPGEYTYTVSGHSYDYTVGNNDQTVNINMSKVTISMNCDDMSAIDSQTFEWGTLNTSYSYESYNYNTVKSENGKITIVTMPGSYKLRVNGVGTMDVTVKEGENNVSVQLYSLKFTTNLSTAPSYYLYGSGNSGNGGKQIAFNAKYYLPAGKYGYGTQSYSSSSSSGKYFMLDSNQEIAINFGTVTISLNCDDMSALSSQTFAWGTRNTSYSYDSYDYNTVKPENGKITIVAVPGSYKFRINGVSTMDVKVKEGENNVSVQLYSIKFTTNQSTITSLYLNSSSIDFNKKYYLPTGEYSYGTQSYSSSNKSFILDSNKEIALNYGKVTVTITDTNGEAAAGIYVSASGTGSYTDENGQVELIVPYGECTISVSGYETRSINVSGDVSESFTVPGYVTFNVVREGNPVEHVSLYDVNTENSVSAEGHNGVFKARITPGGTYRLSGYKGTVVIEEGSTISLGTLRVSSEGMGVAIPMDEWGGASTWDVVVGSTVRLTAIPVSDDKFQCWVVNGREIASPVVDLTITDANTVATAVFDGLVPGVSVARPIHGDVNDDKIVNGTDIQEVINVIVEGER